jgi:hypothetical protein
MCSIGRAVSSERLANTTDRSRWMVQIVSRCHALWDSKIASFQRFCISRADLNNPPTAVGGIRDITFVASLAVERI